jgi:hypothetical protein
MSVTESFASHEAALAGRLTFLDTGTAAAKIQLYDGVRPLVTVAADVGNNLIAEVALQDPAGSVVANALHLLASVTPATVLYTGTPTWARAVNGNGATAFDMDCGITGSGAECILTDAILYAGGVVTIVSATLG